MRQVSQHSLAQYPIVGLDIGSSAIKVAEIRPSGKQWHLFRHGIKSLPPEAVMDGQIKQAEIVTQAIKDLLMETAITTKRVAISLGGPSVITKKIQLAVMTELDLEDQIVLEAEEYIPFDIEDVYLDFQIIGQDDKNMDVLLTACKKDLINSHAQVVRQAGLDPRICDLDLFCIANAYQAFIQQPFIPHAVVAGEDAQNGAVVLVNIGSAFLNIAIIHHSGIPGYIRDYSLGGRQVIQDSQTRYDISVSEAEKLVLMAGNLAQSLVPDSLTQNNSVRDSQHLELVDFQTEIVNPFLEKLLQQIQQAIHFHKTGNPDQAVTGIWISGGCALLPDIASFIGDKFGIPVQMADPFLNLLQTSNKRSLGYGGLFANKGEDVKTHIRQNLQAMAPRFMVALGLALRGDIR